jgi:hypothetical protein
MRRPEQISRRYKSCPASSPPSHSAQPLSAAHLQNDCAQEKNLQTAASSFGLQLLPRPICCTSTLRACTRKPCRHSMCGPHKRMGHTCCTSMTSTPLSTAFTAAAPAADSLPYCCAHSQDISPIHSSLNLAVTSCHQALTNLSA